MTNHEKWKKKLAEAQNGNDLLNTIDDIEKAHTAWCRKRMASCPTQSCKECKAMWLNQEVEKEVEE